MNIKDIDKEIEQLRKKREEITNRELNINIDEIRQLNWLKNHEWYFDYQWGVYGGMNYSIYSHTLDSLLDKIDSSVLLIGDSNYYFLNINLKKNRQSSLCLDKGRQSIHSQNLSLFIDFLQKYRPKIKNDDIKEKARLYNILETLL